MTADRRLPPWADAMDDDDLQFVRRFLLAGGSLKDLAAGYGVSYPTIRGRLDRLIVKVKAAEAMTADDPFERTLRALVVDGKVPAGPARQLLAAHRAAVKPEAKP